MTEKIMGYLFLFVGVFLIVFSAIQVYFVFTKRIEPFELFKFKSVYVDASTFVGMKLPNNPQIELLPAAMVNDPSNIIAHMLFMGFVASIGSRFATIGTQMARPIVVKLKEGHTT